MLKRYPVALLLIMVTLSLLALPAHAQDVGCGVPLELAVGDLLNTRPGINIRNLPTLSGGVVEYLDSSITFRVTEGPVCADGLNWWRVRGPVNFNPGWIAEKESPTGRYLIFPVPPDPETLCADPINLTIGQQVPVVSGGLRVRAEAGLSAQVLTVALANTTLSIVGGPVCANGYNWWQVIAPVNPTSAVNVRGWVAEGFGGDVPWLEEPAPVSEVCAPPLRGLGPGVRAYVNYRTGNEPRNLRAEPTVAGDLVVTLIDGVAFTILEGPVCAGGYNWWKIEITTRPDVVGWLAEGGAGNYWIRRFRLQVRY